MDNMKREMGVPIGKNIPKGKLNAAAKKGGMLGKRASLAKTLMRFQRGRA